MAKKYEETTGSNDVYTLIGETIRYHKHQRAFRLSIAFIIIGLVILVVGIALIPEEMMTAGIILIVVGVVIFALSLILYYATEARRKKLDLVSLGKAKHDKEIDSIEEHVQAIRNKKFGNKDDIFDGLSGIDKFIYTAKHLKELKVQLVPPRGTLVYYVTLDDGYTFMVYSDCVDSYEDFILVYYLQFIANSNNIQTEIVK